MQKKATERKIYFIKNDTERKILYIEIPPRLLHEAFFYVFGRPFHKRVVVSLLGHSEQQYIARLIDPSA